jgi:hypothetical protein
LEAGSQTVDQLPIRLADAEPNAKGQFPTRRITDGAKTVNAWIKDSREQAGATGTGADIFPDDILTSEQFMKPFEYGNDPASAHFARNAQRMLVYTDSTGSVKGMLLTDAEVDSYGDMIRTGALKNAYFMDTHGKIDSQYLPPTCEDGALPVDNAILGKIQAECPRFAVYMGIYNGSIDPEVLDANPVMKAIFQQNIGTDPTKEAATVAFLGAKMPDTTWIGQFARAA